MGPIFYVQPPVRKRRKQQRRQLLEQYSVAVPGRVPASMSGNYMLVSCSLRLADAAAALAAVAVTFCLQICQNIFLCSIWLVKR